MIKNLRMKKFILKNHELIEETQAQVSINERAFLFGDGIFETIKFSTAKFTITKHMKAELKMVSKR
jgi:branched-subunit amino acid aminotransferase/4-amino-4-deoxychorismate lyase